MAGSTKSPAGGPVFLTGLMEWLLPSIPGRPRKSGFVSRGIRGNPEGLNGHIYAPIIPEPQHMGRPCAAVMTKIGGTDMKTPFPNDAAILAIDLAKPKRSFQVCATTSSGEVLYNRKFTRPKLEQFLGKHQPSLVVMEACSTSHHRGRYAMAAGHEVRMIAPSYVKPFASASRTTPPTPRPSPRPFGSPACASSCRRAWIASPPRFSSRRSRDMCNRAPER